MLEASGEHRCADDHLNLESVGEHPTFAASPVYLCGDLRPAARPGKL